MENRKFYVVRSRNLALALRFLGFEYYTFKSKEYENADVYSFLRTEKFDSAMLDLLKLKKVYK